MKKYPIENQVCTLEQAEELTEILGDDAPDSLWVWARNNDGWNVKPASYRDPSSLMLRYVEFINAYTGDELGALLPGKIKIGNTEYIKTIDFIRNKWSAFYANYEEFGAGLEVKFLQLSKYEAQAKADLSIHLLKEKIIKPEDFKYGN